MRIKLYHIVRHTRGRATSVRVRFTNISPSSSTFWLVFIITLYYVYEILLFLFYTVAVIRRAYKRRRQVNITTSVPADGPDTQSTYDIITCGGYRVTAIFKGLQKGQYRKVNAAGNSSDRL